MRQYIYFSLYLLMPLIELRDLGRDAKLAVWKITETEEQLHEHLQLHPGEEDFISRLRKGKRTLQWMASRALLRKLLDTKDPISCPSDADGKPYLVGFPYKISITHSFDYAGVILNAKGECGVDIELVKPKIKLIAHKFLKEQELEFVRSNAQELDALYACWCAKEAVYKLIGKKGTSFRKHMTIQPFDFDVQNHLTLQLDLAGHSRAYKVYYEKLNGYMMGYVLE